MHFLALGCGETDDGAGMVGLALGSRHVDIAVGHGRCVGEAACRTPPRSSF